MSCGQHFLETAITSGSLATVQTTLSVIEASAIDASARNISVFMNNKCWRMESYKVLAFHLACKHGKTALVKAFIDAGYVDMTQHGSEGMVEATFFRQRS